MRYICRSGRVRNLYAGSRTGASFCRYFRSIRANCFGLRFVTPILQLAKSGRQDHCQLPAAVVGHGLPNTSLALHGGHPAACGSSMTRGGATLTRRAGQRLPVTRRFAQQVSRGEKMATPLFPTSRSGHWLLRQSHHHYSGRRVAVAAVLGSTEESRSFD